MNEQPKDPLARIAELEAELARVKYERDMYKGPAYEVFTKEIELAPFTEDDARKLMGEPQGESLLSVIEAAERSYGGRI